MGKKIIAYLLSLCMLLTLLPAAAFAANENKAQVVGGAGYPTLAEAIASVQNGQSAEIQLLDDVTENVTIPEGVTITLDLNGHVLNGGTVSKTAALTNNGTVTIKDSSTGGTIKREDDRTAGYYTIDNQGTMTFLGGTVYNNSGTGATGASLIRNGGVKAATLNIENGTFTQEYFIAIKNDDYGTLNMSGGTINATGSDNINTVSAVQNWSMATITGGTINGAVWTSVWDANLPDSKTVIDGETVKVTGRVVAEPYNGVSVGKNIYVEIKDGNFDLEWRVTENSDVTVAVSGGTFAQPVPEFCLADGFTSITDDEGNTIIGQETGPFVVAGGTAGTDFSFDADTRTLTILTSTPLQLSAEDTITDGFLQVEDGVDAAVTIENLAMDLEECNGSALKIPEGSSLALKVKGNNLLRSYAGGPGIWVDNGAKLTINGTDDDTLEVYGSKNASYDDSGDLGVGLAEGFAGIGGQNESSAYTYTGEITINGGSIIAHGFGYGAGIGGGDFGSGGTITINGGTVTATTGEGLPDSWIENSTAKASGIGASQGQPGGKITITDGTVTATGGYGSAGIGGGTADVTISGGKVTAYGGPVAAGIGGYNQNKGAINITIGADAEVWAYGGENACGIGQGQNTTAQTTISIADGAKVYAFSQEGSNRPAITEVANSAENPANMINAYVTNMTLPADVPITAQLDSDTVSLTVPAGGAGVAFTTGSAGEYLAKTAVPIPPDNITYQFILEDQSKATVTSGTAFVMEEVIAVPQADFTKEETPNAQADYANNRLTGLVAGAKYRLEVPAYYLEATADAEGNLTHEDFPQFYGMEVSIIKLGNGTNTLNSDPQILQTYQPVFTGITVKTQPDKVGYIIGEALDLTGLTAALSYTAGEQQYEKVIALADFATNSISVTPENGTVLEKAETVTVTLTCGEQTATFTVTAAQAKPTLKEAPAASRIRVGQMLSASELSGGVVTGLDGEELDGSWSWKDDREMTRKDTYEETAIFTPDNSSYTKLEVPGISVTVYEPNSSSSNNNNNNRNNNTVTGGSNRYTFSNTQTTTDWNNPFADVQSDDWYYDAVAYANANGLFSGVTANTFAPDQAITRGMLVTVLYRNEENPAVSTASGFADVNAGAYYANAVSWAQANGIVNGYSDTEFSPDKLISREEMAAVLERYAAYRNMGLSGLGNLTQFADQAQISGWARSNVAWAVGAGLLSGRDNGLLDPQGQTTRAEAAAMLQRLLEK